MNPAPLDFKDDFMKKLKPIIFTAVTTFLLVLLSCKNNYIPDIKTEQKMKQDVPVTSVILSPDETGISLVKGVTRQINAHVEPKNASDQGLSYVSDNATVASVDANGLISTHSVGSANITITASDSVSKTVKLIVTAAPVPVASIEFEEQSANPVEMRW